MAFVIVQQIRERNCGIEPLGSRRGVEKEEEYEVFSWAYQTVWGAFT